MRIRLILMPLLYLAGARCSCKTVRLRLSSPAEVIEADWRVQEPPPQNVIVAEFPSMKALKSWYASPQYAEAFAFRAAAVKRRMIFVAGVDEPAG